MLHVLCITHGVSKVTNIKYSRKADVQIKFIQWRHADKGRLDAAHSKTAT